MNKVYYDEFKEALISETYKQVTYNYDKCIEILIKQGLSEDDAIEYLDCNYIDMTQMSLNLLSFLYSQAQYSHHLPIEGKDTER